MPVFKVTMSKRPTADIVIYTEEKEAKYAYEYGIKVGTDIFGKEPDYISVVEQPKV